MPEKAKNYDAIIVGGGPIGLAMAVALTEFMAGLRVALVDRRDFFAAPHDQRASALSAGARRVFEALGVWGAVEGEAQPIRSMKITDSGQGDIARPLFLSFGGEVAPGEPFAHMVPNRSLIAALLEAAKDKVDFIAPAEIAGYVAEAGGARLSFRDGHALTAPLIIAADGTQ